MNFHIVEFEAAYGRSRQIPDSDMPEIVFSGKSKDFIMEQIISFCQIC